MQLPLQAKLNSPRKIQRCQCLGIWSPTFPPGTLNSALPNTERKVRQRVGGELGGEPHNDNGKKKIVGPDKKTELRMLTL